MKMSLTEVKEGLARYLDGEFIPQYKKNHSAAATYGVSVGLALVIENLSNTAQNLLHDPLIPYFGIVDQDSNIDVTKLLNQMKKSMPEEGLKVPVPIIGVLSFTKGDVDTLEGYMSL